MDKTEQELMTVKINEIRRLLIDTGMDASEGAPKQVVILVLRNRLHRHPSPLSGVMESLPV